MSIFEGDYLVPISYRLHTLMWTRMCGGREDMHFSKDGRSCREIALDLYRLFDQRDQDLHDEVLERRPSGRYIPISTLRQCYEVSGNIAQYFLSRHNKTMGEAYLHLRENIVKAVRKKQDNSYHR